MSGRSPVVYRRRIRKVRAARHRTEWLVNGLNKTMKQRFADMSTAVPKFSVLRRILGHSER